MSSQAASRLGYAPDILPSGTVIGRKYRIDEVIAEGGMGIVYKGWHLVLEHPIAIKVVRAEYANHPEAGARFVNEARASAQLHGIHATRVLDLGRIDSGPPLMVLEYLDGFDLRKLLSTRGQLSLGKAMDYILQTCEALAEVHAQGMVHRDLKPENLFITRLPDGTELLKLIDFGISKRLGSNDRSLTQQGQGFGSPDYMAPEQMSTPDQVDARADIWSIGVVIFELLTNNVPFPGDTVQVKCASVMCKDPTPLRSIRPDLPVRLEQVVIRCLQKAPAERYGSVSELVQDLVPFASQESALTLGRIRSLFGDTEQEHEVSSPSSMFPLPIDRPRTTDVTPLPPEHVTRRVEPKRTRHLSTRAMVLSVVVLATAAFALFSRANPGMWQSNQASSDRSSNLRYQMWQVGVAVRALPQTISGGAEALVSEARRRIAPSRVSRARFLVPIVLRPNRFTVPSEVVPPRRPRVLVQQSNVFSGSAFQPHRSTAEALRSRKPVRFFLAPAAVRDEHAEVPPQVDDLPRADELELVN